MKTLSLSLVAISLSTFAGIAQAQDFAEVVNGYDVQTKQPVAGMKALQDAYLPTMSGPTVKALDLTINTIFPTLSTAATTNSELKRAEDEFNDKCQGDMPPRFTLLVYYLPHGSYTPRENISAKKQKYEEEVAAQYGKTTEQVAIYFGESDAVAKAQASQNTSGYQGQTVIQAPNVMGAVVYATCIDRDGYGGGGYGGYNGPCPFSTLTEQSFISEVETIYQARTQHCVNTAVEREHNKGVEEARQRLAKFGQAPQSQPQAAPQPPGSTN